MKISFTIVLLFLFCINCFCQKYGTIEGVVLDSVENTGIAYATLGLIKADLGTTSDKEGKFVFKNVPIGEDILKCSLIGYGSPRRLIIKIFEDSTVFIRINLAACEYDILGGGVCPICKQTDEAIPIAYGEPTSKSLKKAMKGKIMLGGCIISPCNPHWYCKRDRVSF